MLSMARYKVDVGNLPMGVAAPLREAMRVCQVQPAGDWGWDVYEMIGRVDLGMLARGRSEWGSGGWGFGDAYRQRKEFVSLAFPF